MATKKRGQLTTSSEWARHLRPLLRRVFWKAERRAERTFAREATPTAPDRAQALQELCWSIQALALPAADQLALYPDFTCKADELALDFDTWQAVVQGNFGDSLSESQRVGLDTINDRFISLSRNGANYYPDFWTESALFNDANWVEVRRLAHAALDSFGWQLNHPPSNRSAYVQASPYAVRRPTSGCS
jgi:hypothetical protein